MRPSEPGTYKITYSEYTGDTTETVKVYLRSTGKLAIVSSIGDILLRNFRRNETVKWELVK